MFRRVNLSVHGSNIVYTELVEVFAVPIFAQRFTVVTELVEVRLWQGAHGVFVHTELVEVITAAYFSRICSQRLSK